VAHSFKDFSLLLPGLVTFKAFGKTAHHGGRTRVEEDAHLMATRKQGEKERGGAGGVSTSPSRAHPK
jgi:hypothetical protein